MAADGTFELRRVSCPLCRGRKESQTRDLILARPFDPVTIGDLAKLIDAAFALGRRAAGLPADGPIGSDDPPFMREFEEALRKIYGPDEDRLPPSVTGHSNGNSANTTGLERISNPQEKGAKCAISRPLTRPRLIAGGTADQS